MAKRLETDVFVIGTGPAGATFARHLVPAGVRVTLVDAGAKFSARPGRNLKNFFAYQVYPNAFADLVNGLLHPLSQAPLPGTPAQAHENPRQSWDRNLDGACTAYAVGGQAIHWTGVIPRQHPTMERSPLFDTAEWDSLYTEAERALDKHDGLFDRSIRHAVVREATAAHYAGRLEPGREVGTLPMAVRPGSKPGLLEVAGTDTVLRDILDAPSPPPNFLILPEHVIHRLEVRGGKVVSARGVDLTTQSEIEVRADHFVVACGTVLSAQLLWNSGLRPWASGRYLIEHPISFAQVVLSKSLQERVKHDPAFERLRDGAPPDDPLRLPAHDLSPNVWIPVGEGRPWHVQLTKDVVHFSARAQETDDRMVVDFRWYGLIDPDPENRVWFEDDLLDPFGMPRPTVHYHLGPDQVAKLQAMQEDQRELAAAMGTYVPGAEPRLLPAGSCLHLQGATRMGDDPATSVVDRDSRVWGIDNLQIAGNSVIPGGNACNPTLTTVALATRAARSLR